MKFRDHIRLSIISGFLVGSLIGIIDILARVFALSFEWFEFYHTLFISISTTIVFFLVLGFSVELSKKILKFKLNKEKFNSIYLVGGISFILLFYGLVIINNFLIRTLSFLEFKSFSLSFLVFLFSALMGFIIFFKMGKFALLIISYLKKSKAKKFLENYIFAIIIFIVISFFIDIYFLNYNPSYTSGSGIKEYPNIITISLDATRADHFSLYGYPLTTTPNIDRLAENSVVFDNAVSPAPGTLSALTSIYTGRYPFRHNATVRNQVANEDELFIAEILRDMGYVTAGFTSAIFTKSKYGMGQGQMTYRDRLDFFEYSQSFDKLSMKSIVDLFPGSRSFIFNSDGERTSEEINQDVFKFLEKNVDNNFFLSIHYIDPHHPYNLGKQFRKQFTGKSSSYVTHVS